MKKIKLYYNKLSIWVDKYLGYYLANPKNKWRWQKRQVEILENTKQD